MSEEIIDIHEIMARIPHRYPFLLVDRIVDYVAGESAVGIKNVTMNEPHFTGHFPNNPVMPGVMIIEAMAQTAGVLVCKTLNKHAEQSLVYFTSIDEAKFRKTVVPGDTLRISVTKLQARMNIWKFKGEARVGDTLCAEAIVSAMIADRK
jgi:3-hydroxyacyl-[acyl-carrier-protein] dehydratase